jgi:hypothetical protein
LVSDLEAKQREMLEEESYISALVPRRVKGNGLHRIIIVPWHRFLESCVAELVRKEKRRK